MKDVCLFMTITQRAYAEEFIKFFCEEGGAPIYSTPCAGTARSKTLDLLGIERTEKTIMFSVLTVRNGPCLHGITCERSDRIKAASSESAFFYASYTLFPSKVRGIWLYKSSKRCYDI